MWPTTQHITFSQYARFYLVDMCCIYTETVPITTKVVSSNPIPSEVYSMQQCDKVCH